MAKQQMNITSALEALNKLDRINRFLILIEIKFMGEENSKKKIKSAQIILGKILLNLAFAFDKNLNGNSSENEILEMPKEKISEEIFTLFKVFSDWFFVSEIKSFYVLRQDLQDVHSVIKAYEAQPSLDFLDENSDEIKTLKEKILLILSEKFG